MIPNRDRNNVGSAKKRGLDPEELPKSSICFADEVEARAKWRHARSGGPHEVEARARKKGSRLRIFSFSQNGIHWHFAFLPPPGRRWELNVFKETAVFVIRRLLVFTVNVNAWGVGPFSAGKEADRECL